MSSEAERVLKGVTKAVAVNSEASEEVVAQLFWQRLGVEMLRGNYRAFMRRVEGWERAVGPPDSYRGVGLLSHAAD